MPPVMLLDKIITLSVGFSGLPLFKTPSSFFALTDSDSSRQFVKHRSHWVRKEDPKMVTLA